MSERIEFLGEYYEKNKESEKNWLKELEKLFLSKQDAEVKSIVENHFSDLGVISKLTFYTGSNHMEWKKDGKDYFVIERHWR